MNNSKNNKKDTQMFKWINKRLVIVLLLLLVVVIGGTFAWYTYQSRKSALVLTIGDMTDGRVILKPYQVTGTIEPVNSYIDGEYTQVEVLNTSGIFALEVGLYYKINELSEELVNNGLKYTIVQSTSINGPYSLVKTGDFKSYTNNKLDILTVELLSNTYYRVYIWVDSSVGDQTLLENTTLSLELNATLDMEKVIYKESILNGADPVLDEGMIPVTIADDGTVTTADLFSEWYSYEDKKWANAVLVSDANRSKYKGTTGTTIPQSDIYAYFVWIPRYKYQLWNSGTNTISDEQEIQIIFEDADTPMSSELSVGSYITHPAFWWDNDSDEIVDDGETIAGIWVGKFETAVYYSNTAPRIKPDVVPQKGVSIDVSFETHRAFTAKGNSYGLSHITSNGHMMKNSEWGAVAYLSHSKYGINQEIYINNASKRLTGRSGGNVGGSVKTVAEQFSGETSTNQYNSYGYYTWLGQSISSSGTILGFASDRTLGTYASTTGNVSGIYDMSGGCGEHVMSHHYSGWGRVSSSFKPESKYKDVFGNYVDAGGTNWYIKTGRAVHETSSWYSDIANGVDGTHAWFIRGGDYDAGATAGVFGYDSGFGDNTDGAASRSVLVIGHGS